MNTFLCAILLGGGGGIRWCCHPSFIRTTRRRDAVRLCGARRPPEDLLHPPMQSALRAHEKRPVRAPS